MKRALLALLWLLWCAPSHAQAPSASKVSVEIYPSPVVLLAGHSSTAVLRVQNTSGVSMQSVKLRWIDNPSVQISPAELPPLGPLAQAGEALWEFTLTAPGQPTTQVDFIVEYLLASQAQAPERGFVFQSLPVKPRPVEAVSNIASLALVSNLPTLNEFNEGALYVKLSNNADGILRVSRMVVRGPPFLALRPGNPRKTTGKDDRLDLAPVFVPSDNLLTPRNTKVVELHVKASDRVLPGKYTILVEADLTPATGQGHALTLVESQEVEIGVYGEAAVTALTIASIPLFLFIPGYLMFVVFSWLWGSCQPVPHEARTALIPSTSKPELLVGALTLSLLTIWLYPYVTGLFYVERNLLTGYGFKDIVWTWFGSVISGVMAFGLWWLQDRGQHWRVARRTPDPEQDTSGELLRKIVRRKLGPRLDGVTVQVGGQDRRALLLATHLPDKAEVWVIPRVQVSWTSCDASYKHLLTSALTAPRNRQDFKALVRQLRQGEAAGKIALQWEPTTGVAEPDAPSPWIERPLQVASAQVTPNPLARDMLVVTWEA